MTNAATGLPFDDIRNLMRDMPGPDRDAVAKCRAREAKLTKPNEIFVGKSTKKPMEPQHPAPKGTLGEGTYTAKHIISATGARPHGARGSRSTSQPSTRSATATRSPPGPSA